MIGPKGAPRYTLKDAFTRVRDIMRCNQSERLWEQYEGKLGWYESGGMRGICPEERAERMRRVTDTMWHTFNCHNFAEVFRDPWLEEMRQPAFAPICSCIGPSYGYTHDLAWALISLNEHVNWAHREFACGTAEMVQLTLGRIRQNDADVLGAIERALELLK